MLKFSLDFCSTSSTFSRLMVQILWLKKSITSSLVRPSALISTSRRWRIYQQGEAAFGYAPRHWMTSTRLVHTSRDAEWRQPGQWIRAETLNDVNQISGYEPRHWMTSTRSVDTSADAEWRQQVSGYERRHWMTSTRSACIAVTPQIICFICDRGHGWGDWTLVYMYSCMKIAKVGL